MVLVGAAISAASALTWACWSLPPHDGHSASVSASMDASLALPTLSAWQLPGWSAPTVMEPPAAASRPTARLVSIFATNGVQTAVVDGGDGQGLLYAAVGDSLLDGTVVSMDANGVRIRTPHGERTIVAGAP